MAKGQVRNEQAYKYRPCVATFISKDGYSRRLVFLRYRKAMQVWPCVFTNCS